VPAFCEFFDHFPVERWNVIGFATGNQSIVHYHFLIDPARACIAHIDLDRRSRSHFSATNKVYADQNLRAMADDRYRFVLTDKVARKFQRALI
jgi:hypothetical protein